MNKNELINKIAEGASINKTQATQALQTVLESITDTLKEGDKLTLVGFGTFSVSYREARKGINPSTKQPIDISDKAVVKFKPGKELAEVVDNDALRATLKKEKAKKKK